MHNFRLEILNYLSRRAVYFETFRLVEPKLSNHLHSDRNFENFWVNGDKSNYWMHSQQQQNAMGKCCGKAEHLIQREEMHLNVPWLSDNLLKCYYQNQVFFSGRRLLKNIQSVNSIKPGIHSRKMLKCPVCFVAPKHVMRCGCCILPNREISSSMVWVTLFCSSVELRQKET